MKTEATTAALPCAVATSYLLTDEEEFHLTSKVLLFKVIFRLQCQGNEERVFLLWVMVKNSLNHSVPPAHMNSQPRSSHVVSLVVLLHVLSQMFSGPSNHFAALSPHLEILISFKGALSKYQHSCFLKILI